MTDPAEHCPFCSAHFDPRSGVPVTIDVIDICRFADGKLVEHWGVPGRGATIDGAEHMSPITHPDEVARVISNHIERCRA